MCTCLLSKLGTHSFTARCSNSMDVLTHTHTHTHTHEHTHTHANTHTSIWQEAGCSLAPLTSLTNWLLYVSGSVRQSGWGVWGGGREAARRWIISFTRSRGERYYSGTHTHTHTHIHTLTHTRTHAHKLHLWHQRHTKKKKKNLLPQWRAKMEEPEREGGEEWAERRGDGGRGGWREGANEGQEEKRRRKDVRETDRVLRMKGSREAREWIEKVLQKKQIDKEAIERRFKGESSRDVPQGDSISALFTMLFSYARVCSVLLGWYQTSW